MSTRADFIFGSDGRYIAIYKHGDGYPSGAAEQIANALPYAWLLPRFEAEDFAAAFCAGNKPSGRFQGGSVYVIGDVTDGDSEAGYSLPWSDRDYRYLVTAEGGALRIRCYHRADPTRAIYDGPLDGLAPNEEG